MHMIVILDVSSLQSPMFDSKVPHWYHQMCFFGKQRPKTVADIAHFDSLRWEDQQKIKAKVGEYDFWLTYIILLRLLQYMKSCQ